MAWCSGKNKHRDYFTLPYLTLPKKQLPKLLFSVLEIRRGDELNPSKHPDYSYVMDLISYLLLLFPHTYVETSVITSYIFHKRGNKGTRKYLYL
jgi:hypothetical protein